MDTIERTLMWAATIGFAWFVGLSLYENLRTLQLLP